MLALFTPTFPAPLIPCVHSGQAASPLLQPLGPDVFAGLGDAQHLLPSAFVHGEDFGWGSSRGVSQLGRDLFDHTLFSQRF